METGGILVEKADSRLAAVCIRDKDGKALDPAGPGGDLAQGEVESRVIQRGHTGSPVPSSGQGVTVQVNPSGHKGLLSLLLL